MAVGTIYRIGVKSVGSLVEPRPYAWNTRHYIAHAGPDTDTPADLIEAFEAHTSLHHRRSLAKRCRIVRYEAGLAATPKIIAASKDVSHIGDFHRIEYMPSFLCGLIRLHWEPAGQNQKVGKWYAPFIGIISTDVIGGNYTQALGALGQALVGDLPVSPAGMVYRPVIWHKATGTASRVNFWSQTFRYHVYRSRGQSPDDFSMSLFRGLCQFP